MGCVYWIHLPEHTDILTEGYIGVTSRSANERFAGHLSHAKTGSKVTLSKAIRKYGDKIVVKTLLIADDEYCLDIERKLRPHERIGWNVVAGGGKPPKHVQHTEEAKAKISASLKASQAWRNATRQASAARRGYLHSEAAKSKMKEKAQGRLPWETSRADKAVWAMAGDIFQYWKDNKHLGPTALGKWAGCEKPNALKVMHSKFKNKSWNPLKDPEWLQWSKTLNFKESNIS